MSREEIESMFSLSELKQTKVYQEAKQEGIQEGIQEGVRQEKLRLIPLLFKLGLTGEQIAQELNLQLEEVQQELNQQSPNQNQ